MLRLHKTYLTVLSCVLLAPSWVPAQPTNSDTVALLQDAMYLFNRYEEVVPGLNIDGWNTDAKTRRNSNELRAKTSEAVEQEKRRVSVMLNNRLWTSGELLDVYAQLVGVGMYLSHTSNQTFEHGDAHEAAELSNLGNKVDVTAFKVYANLRVMLTQQESRLASCNAKGKK